MLPFQNIDSPILLFVFDREYPRHCKSQSCPERYLMMLLWISGYLIVLLILIVPKYVKCMHKLSTDTYRRTCFLIQIHELLPLSSVFFDPFSLFKHLHFWQGQKSDPEAAVALSREAWPCPLALLHQVASFGETLKQMV